MRGLVVTARVTTLKGPDAGAYYLEETGRYYLDGPEPLGRWHGRGAAALGLTGVVDDDDFLALMDGCDPDGRLLGSGHTDRTVRGFDVTCSAPKSVSVLFAVGDAHVRREVLAAHDAAVAATLGWIEDHAHCRYRVDGEIWTVDAQGLVAAAFREHTSRARDPQIHTHLVIANRVMAPDGRWLALDARTLKCDQRTISALHAAGLRAELTARLGVRWQPVVNGQAEMADAPTDVLEAFSARTRQMETRRDAKVERFVEDLGRQPTARERWKLEREAAYDSRPTKTSIDADLLHAHWHDQLHALGHTPEAFVADITGRANVLVADETMDRTTTVAALSQLRDTQSTWRPAEITREIAAALPTRLGATATDVVARCDRLASHAEDTVVRDISRPVPEGVPLRRDGRPVTEGALDRILTTDTILDEEEHLLALAQDWNDLGGHDAHELTTKDELTAVQQHAAGAVAGERRLVLIVGPAGTGKTTAMRPAVTDLHATGRACFGVAPSAAAADVLAVETGIDADTIDKLLIEHRLDRPPQHRYDLPAGATIVVDEAAMVATPRLAELFDLAARRDWRLALVGDPMQFSAVGRSGMFGHLVDTIGAVELDRVHRFDAPWERDASLRLRRGDTDVVALYEQHGRLHGGTTRQMAAATVAAWRAAIAAGQTAAMMAPTREAVAVLNDLAQSVRLATGELDRHGPTVNLGTGRGHVGDVVATRRNDRTLHTDQGHMVKNRDHWTIDTIQPNGAVTLASSTGRVDLPAAYVSAHVELAYAETSHATQGRTVDRSFLYLDGTSDTRGIYVPLTRGRTTNEVFVVLHDTQTPAEVVADAVARTWVDQPATALRLDRPTPSDRPSHGGRGVTPEPAEPTRSARSPGAVARPALLSEPELRALVEKAVASQMETAGLGYDLANHHRTIADLKHRCQQTTRAVDAAKARLTEATHTLDAHDHPFQRRGHRPEITQARVDIGSLPDQIGELEPRRQSLGASLVAEREATDRTQRQESVSTQATDRLTAALEADASSRGEQATSRPSALLTAYLGTVPDNPTARAHWVAAAGRIEQHHMLWPIREDQILGTHPRSMGQDEYAFTHYAVQRAVADLDHTLGTHRQATGREAPGIGL